MESINNQKTFDTLEPVLDLVCQMFLYIFNGGFLFL